MLRTLPLACVSICVGYAATASAGPQAPREMFAAEFQLPGTGKSVDAIAWRDEAGIYVNSNTLRDLGLTLAAAADDVIALNDVPGLSFKFDQSTQAVILDCSGACFATQRIGAADYGPLQRVTEGSGAFLNTDLVASRIEDQDALAGQFELGLFRPGGFGGTSWTMGARGGSEAIRLETSWTADMPETRTRLRFGDSVSAGAGAAIPFRFGGVQYGTDFSIDPTFITFPTPSFDGEAAAPSTLDLYVNGALKLRDQVDAGPFSVVDAPVVVGAGEARVVVTDALGREQSVNIPFYASPDLLRPGLAQYSIAAGAEREQFAFRSNDYGRGFLAGGYRRGLTEWATAGVETQLTSAFQSVGGDLTVANVALGQLGLVVASSDGEEGAGQLAKLGWMRFADPFSFSVETQLASRNFRRIGERSAPPERLLRATFGIDTARFGSAALNATSQDEQDGRHVQTLGVAYTAPALGVGSLGLSALVVDDGRRSSSITLNFVRTLGGGATALASVESNSGDLSGMASAQYSPPSNRGLGWRAAVSAGARGRLDGALTMRDNHYDADLEVSKAKGGSGVRAQFATGFVWMNDAVMMSRPIRQSFAVVDVGAPGVEVFRDRQSVGRTNLRGRLLVTDMRPYESNRVGVGIDDLPLGADLATDEIAVRPGARAGALVRFPVTNGAGGELRIVDEKGDPLKSGVVLVREDTGARVPVGQNGRIYLSGVNGVATLLLQRTQEGVQSCQVKVRQEAFASNAPVQCAAGA